MADFSELSIEDKIALKKRIEEVGFPGLSGAETKLAQNLNPFLGLSQEGVTGPNPTAAPGAELRQAIEDIFRRQVEGGAITSGTEDRLAESHIRRAINRGLRRDEGAAISPQELKIQTRRNALEQLKQQQQQGKQAQEKAKILQSMEKLEALQGGE